MTSWRQVGTPCSQPWTRRRSVQRDWRHDAIRADKWKRRTPCPPGSRASRRLFRSIPLGGRTGQHGVADHMLAPRLERFAGAAYIAHLLVLAQLRLADSSEEHTSELQSLLRI